MLGGRVRLADVTRTGRADIMRRQLARSAFSAAAILLLTATSGHAAESSSKPSEFIFLVQIVLLICVGRGLGELMQRIGQPSVIGELLAGVLLGPSLFGWVWPAAHDTIFPASPEQKALIDGLAQFGILLLLLLTGMETDLKLVRKVGRAAATISIVGIVVPFACGFALGQFLPDSLLPHPEARLVASLFLGTALSISSVKIVAVVVREMNFMRRNVGQIIIASAVIDDTIGWIIIAIIFSLAAHGSLDLSSIAKSVCSARPQVSRTLRSCCSPQRPRAFGAARSELTSFAASPRTASCPSRIALISPVRLP